MPQKRTPVKKTAKKSPKKASRKAVSAKKPGASPLGYERQAVQALKRLLPYASDSAEIRKKAGFSPALAGPRFAVDVTFVNRAKMRSLNRKFRGKDRPTDVLSFPALEVFVRQGHLGDLVICTPVLESQAKEIGHSPMKELQVLLVHGLLHLLGYDHERSDRESKEMAALEAKILGDTGLIRRVQGG